VHHQTSHFRETAAMNNLSQTLPHSAEQALLRQIAKFSTSDPFIGAKIGSNELTQRLLVSMTGKRGVHLESLLCTLGAIAGYSCQASVRSQSVASGLPETAGLTVVHSEDGKTYYFGDQINKALAESAYSVWAVSGGNAQPANGDERLDLAEIFAYSAASVGTASFGKPRVPEANCANDLPINYVQRLWPAFKPLIVKYCPNPEHWPVLIALSIQATISMGQSALAPGRALQLVMEAAIPMAAIDLKALSSKRAARKRRPRLTQPSSAACAKQSS
jgi:hypothetical protein